MNESVHPVRALTCAYNPRDHLTLEHGKEACVMNETSLVQGRDGFGSGGLAQASCYLLDPEHRIDSVNRCSYHVAALIGLDHDALGVPSSSR